MEKQTTVKTKVPPNETIQQFEHLRDSEVGHYLTYQLQTALRIDLSVDPEAG